jgi:bis(5'-nucleosidyl)-tetraphosphatase
MPPPRQRILSAGVAVVHDAGHGFRFLLLRAYRNWDFPKGLVEAGEDAISAARREVEEETGIVELDFAWGQMHIDTGPYARGKVARYYVARTPRDAVELRINPLLGRPEHSEYRWVTKDEGLLLTAPRVREVIEWANGIVSSPVR